MEVGELRERFRKLIEKDGFYIILFICVCIVAITAVITSKGNLEKGKDIAENKEDELIILDDDLESEETIEIAKMEDKKIEDEVKNEEEIAEEEPIDEEVAAEEPSTDPVQADKTIAISNPAEDSSEMVAPVIGAIGTEYTQDSLIYSETLEEWTAHKGIDIMAEEGAQVMASLSGTVQEVYDDPLWGKVVIIDHGNELLTKYANLSEKGLVKEGVKVNKGDVIGTVGKSAQIEMLMKPHVHFEVIENGISVNPNKYLPSFMQSN